MTDGMEYMIDYDDELVLEMTPLVWPDSPEQWREWEYGGGEFSGPPRVPEWLAQLVCSDAPSEEKRKKIEHLIRDESNPESEPFIVWCLLNLSKLHKDLKKLRDRAYQIAGRDIHKGLGFSSHDEEFFTNMSAYLRREGMLSPGYLDSCRRENSKGASHLGKYHDQLIGLIALGARCEQNVTPKLAKLFGIKLPRKKRATRRKKQGSADSTVLAEVAVSHE